MLCNTIITSSTRKDLRLEEITKNNLEIGVLEYRDEFVAMFLSRADHCEHYEFLMASNEGMVFGVHLKTIKDVMALPIRWENFTLNKHKDGEVVGVIPLDPRQISDTSFHGN